MNPRASLLAAAAPAGRPKLQPASRSLLRLLLSMAIPDFNKLVKRLWDSEDARVKLLAELKR